MPDIAPLDQQPAAQAKPYSRVLIAGGSLIAGLGHSGSSFGQSAGEELGDEVLDLALSGEPTRKFLGARDEILEFDPDLVLAEVGYVDAMVHPVPKIKNLIERWAPESWHGVAGLEPRARYSSKSSRRLRQVINSRVKVWVKGLLYNRLSLGARLIPLDESLADMAAFIEVLEQTDADVVLIGVPPVDGDLFPQTDLAFEQWNEEMRKIAATRPRMQYVGLDTIRQWDDYLLDRCHLSESGHVRAAEEVVSAVRHRKGLATTADEG